MNKRNRTYKNIKKGGQRRGLSRGVGSRGVGSRGVSGPTMRSNPMRGSTGPGRRVPPPPRTISQRVSGALGATRRGIGRVAGRVGSAIGTGARRVGSAAATGARAVGSAAATGARALGSAAAGLGTSAASLTQSVLAAQQNPGYPGGYPQGYPMGPGGYPMGPDGYPTGPDGYPREYGDNVPREYGDNVPREYGDNVPREYGDNVPREYNNNDSLYRGSNVDRYYNNNSNNNYNNKKRGKNNSYNNYNNKKRGKNILYNNSNITRNSIRKISSVSSNLIENEIVPGVPIDISPDQYEGPQKPGIYKVPFEKDANTGFLQTMFMTRSPEGYKYYKIYGTDVRSLESDIKNFITFVKSTNSPTGKFKNTLDNSIEDLKNDIEEQKAKYATLEKQFDYLEPQERTMASQTLALIQSKINNLIEELDDALRIKESA